MSKRIQRVEISDVSVHCPFCGAKVVDAERDGVGGANDTWANSCAHTLFVAHDMGFVYRAPLFDRLIKIDAEAFDDDDPDIEDGVDAFTDTLPLPEALKFASYQGPPSEYGIYVGFVPSASDG
jgi:hypothetical protein